MHRLKFKLLAIIVHSLILAFLLSTNGYSYVKEHTDTILELRTCLKLARKKILDFDPLIAKGIAEVSKLEKLLSKYQTMIPMSIWVMDGTEFEQFDDGIMLYTNDKGKGIKSPFEEKLYKTKQSLIYTHKDLFQYRYFVGDDQQMVEQYITPEIHFWRSPNRKGFSLMTPDGDVVYQYYCESKEKRLIKEKISLGTKESYTLDYSKVDPVYYYRFVGDKSIIVHPKQSISFELSKDQRYTVWSDGNLSLTDTLNRKVYSIKPTTERSLLMSNLEIDFPALAFLQYLKALCATQSDLSRQGDVYLLLINQLRKSYNLKPLIKNSKLNKICNAHGKYIIANKPKNLHIQNFKKKGYIGTTPFQRRKRMGYTHRVNEWIFFGNNPIRQFIKQQKFNYIKAILDPTAIEFGYGEFKRHDSSFIVMMVGRDETTPKVEAILYPLNGSNLARFNIISRAKVKGASAKNQKFEITHQNAPLASLFIYNSDIKADKISIQLNGNPIDENEIRIETQSDGRIYIGTTNELEPESNYEVHVQYRVGDLRKELSGSYTFAKDHFLYKPF